MSAKFQIPQFETIEEGDQEMQMNSNNETQQQLNRQNQNTPDLHLQNSFQTNGGEVANPRGHQGSHSAQLESELAEGMHRRGRSKSAPAVMWVAMQYGRELRRMSDEFDQGLPHPTSTGNTSELKKAGGWIDFFHSIFGQRRRK